MLSTPAGTGTDSQQWTAAAIPVCQPCIIRAAGMKCAASRLPTAIFQQSFRTLPTCTRVHRWKTQSWNCWKNRRRALTFCTMPGYICGTRKLKNIARNSPELCAALVGLTASQNGGLSVTGLDWVNWKAKKPHEALYMSKPEYKAASKAQGRRAWDIGVQQHAVAVCLRNGAQGVRRHAGRRRGGFADKYKNLWTVQRFGLVRVWNYIRKQQESARKIHSIGGTVGFCVDYWKDAERAGLDLKSEVVALPHSVTGSPGQGNGCNPLQGRRSPARQIRENGKAPASTALGIHGPYYHPGGIRRTADP